MNDPDLEALLAIVQHDPGQRGLRRDPADNLITRTAGDFAAACRHVASLHEPKIVVVTGFTIPNAKPPTGETDGPLGALFLARAWQPLGIQVTLMSDGTTIPALRAGVTAAGLADAVPVVELSQQSEPPDCDVLIAVERVGPSREKPDRCFSMRGLDMTDLTRPAHLMFERPGRRYVTIGIGDGGNEIGMGKVPRDTIQRNIVNGELVACRVPTDYLIVAGISNWGAYALAAGVRALRGATCDTDLFDVNRERSLLETLIAAGPLVDGVTLESIASVDGRSFNEYSSVLNRIGDAAGITKVANRKPQTSPFGGRT